jgi:alkylation response protein AidB-like acyl-CoA dehydrogenase
MARGDVRAGVAFAHLRRPGPPVLTATATKGGWRIDGAAPWVTGWGRIDIVFVGARVGDDLAWLLVDATASPSMRIHLLDLAAVRASATVVVDFDGHVVGADRLVRLERFDDWKERDRRNARPNASLALGLTARACALLGPSPLDDELVDVRAVLDAAGPDEMPVARAASTELAVRATAALVVACGGRSIVTDHHAQRLAREALFLLVQAQTPAIRAEQLRILTGRVGDLRRG